MLEIANAKINRFEGFSGKIDRLIIFSDDDFSEMFLFNNDVKRQQQSHQYSNDSRLTLKFIIWTI